MRETKQILVEAKLDKTFWGTRILSAEKRGEFTKDDLKLAFDWQTCACGHQSPLIPRHPDSRSIGTWPRPYMPLDKKLTKLGSKFYGALCNNRFKKAAKVMVKIEIRAKQILEAIANGH